MLDFQLVQAPMRFGLAEGTDPHQVPFGTLVTAENCCWNKSGLLEKRNGTTALSTSITGGGNITAASRLFTRGKELCLITGTEVYSYGATTWKRTANLGQLPNAGLTWDTIQSSYDGAQASDVAYVTAGMYVHAWITGNPADGTNPTGKLYYQTVYRPSGSRTTSATAFDPGSSPRLLRTLSDGTNWIIVYNDGVNIKCTVNGAAAVTLKTNGKDGGAFDACIIGSNFVVAYNLGAGGIGLAAYSIVSVPVLQTSGSVTGEAAATITAININGSSSDLLWIGYFVSNGGSSKFRIATATATTLVQALAPTDVDATGSMNPGQPVIGVKRINATSCLYAYSAASQSGTTYADGVTISLSVGSGGALGSPRRTAGVRLMTQPFSLNGKLHAFVGRFISGLGANLAATATYIAGDSYLVEMDPYTRALPHRLVGKVDLLTTGQWRDGFVSVPASISTTEFDAMLPTQSAVVTGALAYGTMLQACKLVTATAGVSLPSDMWRSVTIGPETYLSAGVLAAYDGRMVFDFGWSSDCPFGEDFGIAGGGSIEDGTHIYQVAPEYRSAAGVLHRGPTNTPRTVTTATGSNVGTVTMKIIPCHLSQKYDDTGAAFVADPVPPELVLYRAVLNSGTIPQRLTVEPKYNVLLQTLYTSPLTFADNRSDFNLGNVYLFLSNRPAIYTGGGELDDFQPPSALTLTFHQGRMWLVGGDGRTVWFSKDSTVNPGVAPGFHPTMILAFDKTLTALAPMDDKLIAFAADTFWYVIGVGPAPNGQNGDYQINRVQTDVGCTNARSVVSTPDGIIFQSVRGIYLLTRSLELVWIGRPIKDQLTAFPNITSAVLVASKNEVRFTCNDGMNSSSTVLIYNYVEKQWTTARYTVAGVYGGPIADACMWNGMWTFVTTTGVVVEETAAYMDGSTWVPMTVETARVSAGGPLAFQSVRNFSLEGISRSNHDLTVSVGFDNETTYPQTITFAAGSSVTAIGPLESLEISIGTRRKCQSIRFKIQDATPTNPGTYPVGSGQGLSLDMLGIEVGMKKGFAVRSASRMG